MRLGSIEVCYIPYNKSQYQLAREAMAKVTLAEAKNIIIGATFIMATTANMLYAKFNVDNFTDNRILGRYSIRWYRYSKEL